ncbi:MAG: glucoamylase family protein, partial [Bacteriovoracales bacterium]
LAIDQGPIVVMIENYRSGLLWKLFMKIPDVQNGLKKLGFINTNFRVYFNNSVAINLESIFKIK